MDNQTHTINEKPKPTELDRHHMRYMDHLAEVARHHDFWRAAHNATGVELPYWPTDKYLNITQYDASQPGQPIDTEATIKLFAKIIKWAVSNGYKVEKDYDSNDLNVYIKVPYDTGEYDYERYNVYAPRDITCTPKVVGKKTIAAKPAEAPKQVDVIEWDCDKISFLAIDTD